MSPVEEGHRLVFSAQPSAPAEARRFVVDLLHRWGMAARADEAELLVSELVTNVVRHTGDEGVLEVSAIGETVRVAAIDHGAGQAGPRHPTPEEPSGRGLAIVEAVASRWGVETGPAGSGKTVWFELDG